MKKLGMVMSVVWGVVMSLVWVVGFENVVIGVIVMYLFQLVVKDN